MDTIVATKLARPGNPQLTITDSGLAFSWIDRSSYETRYNVSVKAIPWSGDTVYQKGTGITGPNATSGFLSWNHSFWNFIPPQKPLKKIIVGLYAARDTAINGDSIRFYSDVVWIDTLIVPNPTLNTVTLTDSGIQISWQNKPSWAVHVAALIQMADSGPAA